MSTVTFIGLGTMGRGMVRNLLAHGHSVTVWNRSAGAAQEMEALGAQRAETLGEAVAGAEFVMCCLSDDEAVRQVVLAPGGLLEVVAPSSVMIELSTIDPDLSAAEADAFAQRGIVFLDAPVFGSKLEAEAGGLWVVVGGPRDVFDRANSVFAAISESAHYMGGHGSGARMKLVGNLVVASQIEALGEAMTLAKKAGLDLHDVLGVLKVTDARSPIFDRVGVKLIADNYTPSFALKLMRKDGRLILDFADRLRVPLPAMTATAGIIERGVEAGWGDENASALIKVLAGDAGVDLAAAGGDRS